MRIFKAKKIDYLFALGIILLSFFGIVMIASSSSVTSAENFGSSYHYVIRQAIYLIIGLILMFFTSQVDYRFWRKNAFLFLIISLVFLILVLIPGIGQKTGGAQRWIGFGIFKFQPTEIIKLGLIIYLAAWLEKRGKDIGSFVKGFLPFALLLGLIILLIMGQPDLGTTIVVIGVAATMFFACGAPIWQIFLGTGILSVIILILIKAAPYRMQRFLVFLNPSVANTQASAYHINQALIAIGSGGLWGLGFGQSRQKYFYLPMAHNDSIFAIISEELGFIRTGVFLFFFLCVITRGYQIAKRAPDNFAKFLAVGITSWILIQAFVNIGSMLSLIPMTGVPLPFISYGGSSLIMLFIGVGIMLNISKESIKS